MWHGRGCALVPLPQAAQFLRLALSVSNSLRCISSKHGDSVYLSQPFILHSSVLQDFISILFKITFLFTITISCSKEFHTLFVSFPRPPTMFFIKVGAKSRYTSSVQYIV